MSAKKDLHATNLAPTHRVVLCVPVTQDTILILMELRVMVRS